MKSGHGSFRWKRTRPGSTIWTSRTRSFRSLAAAPRYRSKENLTSSAVTGSPLWNFTPLRRTNSYVRPSFDTVHDSARLGVLSPAGIGFTSASWMAYSTMNGLMNASVSIGSSQREARVTWSPQVSVPSGAAPAGPVKADSSSRRTSVTLPERAMESPVMAPPPVCWSSRREGGSRPCELRRVAGDGRALHQALVACAVEGRRAVEDAAIVPDDQVALHI